ncbi:LysR family transcriptional regulator [Enterovibrio calviensis]|uniref:LysR family transcriptional regulator n=1 Tax=Enterovibrio calviensis TaxID=91359 RepID=UPI0004878D52|nr:LysR family transcriptional regulator [Enterovibrio calviensis]
MNLVYLQTFLVVTEERSVTKAADILDVSKGLVSRHIKRLEESLNVRLLHRTTRTVAPTEAGKELYEKAKQIQRLAFEAEVRIKGLTDEISGDLKITAPFEFGRALCRHVISTFSKQYPTVRFILDFGPQLKDVEFGDYDIAFRAYEALPNDVIQKRLGYIRNVLVCSKDYDEKSQITCVNDLRERQFILNNQNDAWNTLILIEGNQEYSIKSKGNISSSTYHSMLELALQGMGIASLPYYQVEAFIEKGELVHVLPDVSVKAHHLSLIYANRRVTPSKISAFNKAVTEWLVLSDHYIIEQ